MDPEQPPGSAVAAAQRWFELVEEGDLAAAKDATHPDGRHALDNIASWNWAPSDFSDWMWGSSSRVASIDREVVTLYPPDAIGEILVCEAIGREIDIGVATFVMEHTPDGWLFCGSRPGDT